MLAVLPIATSHLSSCPASAPPASSCLAPLPHGPCFSLLISLCLRRHHLHNRQCLHLLFKLQMYGPTCSIGLLYHPTSGMSQYAPCLVSQVTL
jgi:hypothetical protein